MKLESIASQISSTLQDLNKYQLITEAERNPDAIAIPDFNCQHLTYSHLHAYLSEVLKTQSAINLVQGDRTAAASLDSITQILAELKTLSEEDTQRLLANVTRFMHALQQLHTDVFQSQLTYWKQQLNGDLPAIQLPIDRPRSHIQTLKSARHFLKLPLALTEALKQLSQQEGASLYMTLLAAFKTLLYRYSGQEDILVGSPFANCKHFINTLVIRTDLSGNPTFEELLSRVREVVLGAYAHQDIPLEKLVAELQPQDLSRLPIFQVMFALQNASMPALQLTDLSVDLFLNLSECSDGLSGFFEYNTDLFDAETIARMSGHFQTLLEGIVAHPQQHISHLPILSTDERYQLLVEWNDTEAEYSQDICIHQLFEAQVERTPNAIAVVFEQQLTYQELNCQANQLAHHLKSLGVGPGTFVGVYMDRGLEMIPAVLGILKAGGAYVPLETSFPKARIEWILSSLSVRCLVTQQSHLQTFDVQPQSALEHLICLDADTVAETANTEASQMSAPLQIWRRSHLSLQPKENLPRQSTPDHTAYIIFTSGSTGTPKGVAVRHKPVINLIEWVNKTFNVNASDRILFITSLSFDLSVYDIFGLLAAGGSIRVVSSQDVRDPLALAHILSTEPITFWDSAPPALQQLVPFLPNAKLSGRQHSLRLVFMSGDWIPVKLPDIVKSTFPGVEVISLGGATEATVWSNFYRIGEVDPTWASIPYGKPIQNAQYYILDPYSNPCPIGVPGELYIGGECLATGYTDPVKTVERFVPHPFNHTPGTRLYRTGDLARYSSDGNIQFLGRTDHQVKIRGFRIELGEIEATLSQHPAVRESIVLAQEDERGKRLVAYIALQDESLTASQVRSFVKEKLPEYMVPSAFVFLEALPMTSNGKVDRRALPSPDAVVLESEATYLAPQTPIEEVLVLIWTEVLGLQKVGIQDNFFELGGHSLLATQVVSRIREAFQVELSLRQLFESPNVAGLAQRIEAQRTHAGFQVPPIQPAAHQGDMLLSFAQARLWFLDQLGTSNAAYNIYAVLRLIGSLNVAALEQSLNEIYKRHAALRTTFFTSAGQPIQVISPPRSLPLPIVDLVDIPVAERKARELAQQPFDLVQGPLFQAQLLRLSQDNHLLVLTMHHIVSDGWSMGVLVQELITLYEAFSQGQPSPLSELPIQYTDFAHWQQQWLQGEVLESQLSYWQQQLQGAQTALDLPTDRPRPPVQTFRGAQKTLVLPLSLTEALKRLSRQQGVTLFMTLLAAFQTLLYRYTGQEDILVGSPIANRNSVEIEGLIGFFVNTLVIRTDLSSNPTFEQLLARVREVALGAYAHQDVPFEKLVGELQPERDLSRSPLFQVMFALQNTPMPTLELADVSVSPLNIDNGTSKFDLLLNLTECSEGLSGFFEYNTDLFDAATIARMAGHLQVLLEGIVAHPQQRITELPILSATERHQLLVEWNDTSVEYSQDVCIHQLFEATVERSPYKVAVVFENQQLTYDELNQRANQLASYLKKCGVGVEGFVGICVERSLHMVVGLLAILKAGGTYVPIDPQYPKDRIAFVLEDTTTPVLLTQASLAASLPTNSARVICLDTDWEIIAQEDRENLQSEVTPKNLAYIIYTSGSTGKPKGVQILHRAVVSFLTSMSLTPGLTAQDILLSVTTISFDIAVLEIFLPLTVGASLVVTSPEVVRDVYALQELLLNSGATVMQATPATWRLLLEARWQGKADLKILCGGEAMSRTLAAQLRDRVGSLWNVYGPTETTIWSTVHQVEEVSECISIGRPIANTQIYLLDSCGQPVPIGVPGELHIGGVGLARGYLNRPELTAEKFIHHPYSDQPEARLYKTGDLARYLIDGSIECLGRIDHQVKIRGFRIELGEIESVLSKHRAVRQTVVVGREDLPGDKHLVAYVVPHQQTLTTSELRSFLKEKLPEYMVPSAFTLLEALPLTPNGKIDRRALPMPELSRPELEKIFVAPRDPLELQLTKIWEEVLGIQRVGVRDNFFELGGHSLLAVRLFAQIEKALGKKLPLTILFAAPTIEQLANTLRSSGCDAPIESLVPLKLGGDKPPLFCIYGILLYLDLALNLDSEQPVYGVYIQDEVDLLQAGRLNQLSALNDVAQLASRYLKEIRTLQPVGPYFLAGASFGGLVAFEMAQQLQMQGEKVSLLALFDTPGPDSMEKLPWRKWVSLHLRNLFKEGAIYVLKKVRRRISLSKRKLRGFISRIYSKFDSRSGWTSLTYLQKIAQRDIRQQARERAVRKYVPQPYAGKMILFQAMDRDQFDVHAHDNDPQFGWGKLAAGGLDVHGIPADHISILKEPHVQIMATKLKTCLEHAQADGKSL